MFFVEFTDAALEDLDDFRDPPTKERLIRIVKKELSNAPSSKGKIIGKSRDTGIIYFEKRFFFGAGYRVYYTILNQVVIIDKVEYEGITRIESASTKKKA